MASAVVALLAQYMYSSEYRVYACCHSTSILLATQRTTDRAMSKPSKRSFEVVSPSLLESVKIHPIWPEFNLGMDDYPCFGSSFCENAAADAGPSKLVKRPKLLSLKNEARRMILCQ